MSAKRKPPEASFDEETNECSDSVFHEEDNVKRAKHTSLSDTTLRNLPVELLEHILIEVVTAEVKDARLVKRVWKEKADHVIDRLSTVCSLWKSVVTTDFFRNKVHGILEGTAEKTLRLEVLQRSSLDIYALDVTTMKDELFVLWKSGFQDYSINVYDRSDMKAVKDVIRLGLPARNPLTISACRVSNCLYLLDRRGSFQLSVLRITKTDDHQFNVSVVISFPWLPNPCLAVTTNGDLVLSRQRTQSPAVISVCDANGVLQHEMKMSMEFYALNQIVPTSKYGNIVLVSCENFSPYRPQFTEIDLHGTILRQSLSPVDDDITVSYADCCGRMLLVGQTSNGRINLLDREFNLLDFTGPKLEEDYSWDLFIVHYNIERNELVRVFGTAEFKSDILFFRFTEK